MDFGSDYYAYDEYNIEEFETAELSSRIEIKYDCDKCGHITVVEMSPEADIPLKFECEKCGEDAIMQNSNPIDEETEEERIKRITETDPYKSLFGNRSIELLEKALQERIKILHQDKKTLQSKLNKTVKKSV